MNIEKSFKDLQEYCINNNFKGWDPYDGLNSKFFERLPIKNNKLARLAWIQFFKRSPINLRKLLLVPKQFNNKALALFLSASCKEYSTSKSNDAYNRISNFAFQLLESAHREGAAASWGYNFDWQARAFFQPKNTGLVVTTAFVTESLLDAYQILRNDRLLETARSACNFVLNELNRTYDNEGDFSFSYSKLDKSVVFNASLLGSRLLSRVYHYTKEDLLILEARKSVSFCCKHQHADGSWPYGTATHHQWVDSFHTGYNLECISDYMKYSGDKTFAKNLSLGLQYYLENFFTDQGIPKYYSNSVYPVDVHATAQLVVTLSKLGIFQNNIAIVERVLGWTIKHMKSPSGYYYYQMGRHFTTKISYMRWAQAWMYYGLATFIYEKSIKVR